MQFTQETSHTYLSSSQRKASFLIFVIQDKNTIFNLITPEQDIALQIFDPIVRRNKLVHACLPNVLEVFFRLIKRFGGTNFQKTWKCSSTEWLDKKRVTAIKRLTHADA